ncbi:hypothetical protein pb186bvf_019512 [Paramecium bursaria]
MNKQLNIHYIYEIEFIQKKFHNSIIIYFGVYITDIMYQLKIYSISGNGSLNPHKQQCLDFEVCYKSHF